MAVVEAVPAETTDAETASDDETEGMKDDDVMAPNNRIGNFKHFQREFINLLSILVKNISKYYKFTWYFPRYEQFLISAKYQKSLF